MVYDHYQNRFPGTIIPAPSPPETQELRQLIEEFRQAVAAARLVDRLTKQPDCEDPTKAKLEERVAALESQLDKIRKALLGE